MGVSEDTALVKSYVPQDVKDSWKEEADRHGFSLSKYVAAKVEQSRAHDHTGRNDTETDSETVEELRQRIDELETQLEQARSQQPDAGGAVSILEDGQVKQVLSYRTKTLEELLRELIENTAVDQLIRKPVETRLYELAADGQVEFQRGNGWRLVDGGDSR
jgi:hypothetical protein